MQQASCAIPLRLQRVNSEFFLQCKRRSEGEKKSLDKSMRRPFIYLKEYKDVFRHNGARSRQTAFNVHLCKISIMNYSRGKWRSRYLLFCVVLYSTVQYMQAEQHCVENKAWIQCRILHLNNSFSFFYTAVLSDSCATKLHLRHNLLCM